MAASNRVVDASNSLARSNASRLASLRRSAASHTLRAASSASRNSSEAIFARVVVDGVGVGSASYQIARAGSPGWS